MIDNDDPLEPLVIVISSLSDNISHASLKEAIRSYKTLELKIRYQKGKPIGHVLFASEEECQRVVGLGHVMVQERPCPVRVARRSELTANGKNSGIMTKIERLRFLKEFYEKLDKIGDIANYKFHVIDFEALLTINKDRAYPCEVGISEFTIGSGEIGIFHTLIDPRPLPTGHHNTITYTIQNVHGIDVSWFLPQHEDIANVWNTICQFTKESQFLLAKDPTLENGCLNWLAGRLEIPNPFKVYDVIDFMHYLHTKYIKDIVPSSLTPSVATSPSTTTTTTTLPSEPPSTVTTNITTTLPSEPPSTVTTNITTLPSEPTFAVTTNITTTLPSEVPSTVTTNITTTLPSEPPSTVTTNITTLSSDPTSSPNPSSTTTLPSDPPSAILPDGTVVSSPDPTPNFIQFFDEIEPSECRRCEGHSFFSSYHCALYDARHAARSLTVFCAKFGIITEMPGKWFKEEEKVTVGTNQSGGNDVDDSSLIKWDNDMIENWANSYKNEKENKSTTTTTTQENCAKTSLQHTAPSNSGSRGRKRGGRRGGRRGGGNSSRSGVRRGGRQDKQLVWKQKASNKPEIFN